MQIVICDDDVVYLSRAVELISALPAIHGARIHQYTDPAGLMKAIEAAEIAPDIAVLDIRMRQDGIETARQINQKLPDCQIIFLTGYLAYATRAYDAEHAYFILKKEFEQKCESAFERAIGRIRASKQKSVLISFNNVQTIVPVREILYVERAGRKTRVVCEHQEHTTYVSPSELLQGAASCFVRCHNSYYVNPAWVRMFGKTQIVLCNGVTLPVSRAYGSSINTAMINYALSATNAK